ncbi:MULTISPECIES: hypothetical protein [Pseudomonas]|nr:MULTISPECIES: hypothetical protein [Pseudomonas]
MLRNAVVITTLSACMLFAGCVAPPSASQSAPVQLEPLGQIIPQNTERTAMIERIIANDPTVISSHKPVLNPTQSNDSRIAMLRKELGFTLPDSYWKLYKQNLEALQFDLNHQHYAAREQYIKTYSDELNRVDSSTLQVMSTAPKTLDEKTRQQWSTRMNDRLIQYVMTSEESFKVAKQAHIDRMAAMDRQYDVCSRKADCWDAPAGK